MKNLEKLLTRTIVNQKMSRGISIEGGWLTGKLAEDQSIQEWEAEAERRRVAREVPRE